MDERDDLTRTEDATMTTKSMNKTLTEIIEKTMVKAEGLRAEYAWFHLREAFPRASEQKLAGLAKFILRHTGN